MNINDSILELYSACNAAAGRVEQCESEQYITHAANHPGAFRGIASVLFYCCPSCGCPPVSSVWKLVKWSSSSGGGYNDIPRTLPLLVGFYLQPGYKKNSGPPIPLTVTVIVGPDAPLPPVELVPGEIRFAIEDRFVMPLAALSPVRLELSDPAAAPFCYLVYGDVHIFLGNNMNWTGTLRSGARFAFAGGLFGTIDDAMWQHGLLLLPSAPERGAYVGSGGQALDAPT